MICVKDLVKTYKGGAVKVLKGISLDICDGEFVVITGASGSGKSTLMNVLSGLEKPDSGSIVYDGDNISEMNEQQLTVFRRKKVGFIFQHYYLLSNLNVIQNVKMGADLTGNKDYNEIIEKVGLTAKCKNRISELSGGEQQRVSIARALAKKPNYLFLDEPTGALDESTGRNVLDYIVRLQRENGFTMILVTHNLNIAEMADTVIKMNSGEICVRYKNTTKKSAYEIGW